MTDTEVGTCGSGHGIRYCGIYLIQNFLLHYQNTALFNILPHYHMLQVGMHLRSCEAFFNRAGCGLFYRATAYRNSFF